MAHHARSLEKAPPAGSRAQKLEAAPQGRGSAPRGPAPGGVRHVQAMQQLVGNRAVMRMLDARRASAATAVQALREDDEVQRAGGGGGDPSDQEIRSAAAEGVRTPSSPLPFLDRIQASFGSHSVAQVQAHAGGRATRAAQAMNAQAYASGSHVVFGAASDLRTTAHEAAHVVQQRAGVQLAGGVGRAGDPYERHADAVADAVVAGRSAEGLLEPFAAHDRQAQAGATQRLVQRTIRVGETTFDDASQVEALLREAANEEDASVVWHDAYVPILQELSERNAEFATLPDLLLRMGGVLVAAQDQAPIGVDEHKEEEGPRENPQDLLSSDYWKRMLTARGNEHYQKSQRNDYWNGYGDRKKPSKRTVDQILEGVGPGLLAQIREAGDEFPGQMKLYRTLPDDEAAAILEWYGSKKENTERAIRMGTTSKELKTRDDLGIMPVVGHLGDRDQAATYYRPGKNTMLEFTLKPGAHKLLFTPEYMALARTGRDVSVMAEHERLVNERVFPAATANEGNLAGYVGVKAEDRGPFSLTMGKSEATHLLFQLFVESVRPAE